MRLFQLERLFKEIKLFLSVLTTQVFATGKDSNELWKNVQNCECRKGIIRDWGKVTL